jgi:hypothetical protein
MKKDEKKYCGHNKINVDSLKTKNPSATVNEKAFGYSWSSIIGNFLKFLWFKIQLSSNWITPQLHNNIIEYVMQHRALKIPMSVLQILIHGMQKTNLG